RPAVEQAAAAHSPVRQTLQVRRAALTAVVNRAAALPLHRATRTTVRAAWETAAVRSTAPAASLRTVRRRVGPRVARTERPADPWVAPMAVRRRQVARWAAAVEVREAAAQLAAARARHRTSVVLRLIASSIRPSALSVEKCGRSRRR